MSTIVLAYSGGFASSVAVPWLRERHAADVVTLTLDLGQGEDLGELRERALACGAARAHVIDARDDLVREFRLPSIGGGPLGDGAYPQIDELARPLIARSLLEVARIEGTDLVAHASEDKGFDDACRAADPEVQVLAPAREWRMDAEQLLAFARARGVALRHPPPAGRRITQNLWGRVVRVLDAGSLSAEPRTAPVSVPAEPAHLEIRFEGGIPVAVNGVPMRPVELVESVALIAGRHGVGLLERRAAGGIVEYDAPAAVVLHAARAVAGERPGVVRLAVGDRRYTVLGFSAEQMVSHA